MSSLHKNKIDSQPQPHGPIKLTYALPTEGEHSAWSLLGCTFSLVLMSLVGLLTSDIWDAVRFGGYASIRIQPTEFLLSLVPLACCMMGQWRGKRILAILGIIISLATLIFAIIAAAGSPWGASPAIGCCVL